jgi:spoIIIJ-associated protein
MNKYNFEGKTFEEVKERALYELKESENNIIIKVIAEKNGLLKKSVTIEVIKYSDVIDYVKETLTTIINLMNLNPTFEVKRRDNSINIKIYSDNNSILIGKNGRSIQALQLLIRQMLANKLTNEVLVNLDVENYKEKKLKSIEFLAKKIAREVSKTKVETKMDSMNSYERRVVHNLLANNKYVYTESIGEEPNRCVVIKLKEEQE